MNRRNIVLAALGAAPLLAVAQPARKVPVVGFLNPGSPGNNAVFPALREGLRELGYVDGESVRIEDRWARGKPETLPRLAQELVALKVDVLVSVAPPSVRAAKQATDTLPIVAVDLEGDPIASGYAASLGRPGGNLTGPERATAGAGSAGLAVDRPAGPVDRRVLCTASTAGHLAVPPLCAKRRLDVVWRQLRDRVSPARTLCGEDPQGRQARRSGDRPRPKAGSESSLAGSTTIVRPSLRISTSATPRKRRRGMSTPVSPTTAFMNLLPRPSIRAQAVSLVLRRVCARQRGDGVRGRVSVAVPCCSAAPTRRIK